MGSAGGERIYVTCETKSCMPGPSHILAGATIGNNGLKIVNLGEMAVTVNKQASEEASSIKGTDLFSALKKRRIILNSAPGF